MSIGRRLRTLREQRKLGQAEIAAVADVAIPTVSEWENDKKRPGRERLAKVAAYYEVPIEYILSGDMSRAASEPMSLEEKTLLDLFRHVDPEVRSSIMTILKASAVVHKT